MTLKPLPGYVLVEIIEDQGIRESGFIEPESTREKPAKGKVLKVGEPIKRDGEWFQQSYVEVGETIVFKRWNGQDIKEGGKDLKFVEFKDIMGVYG